MSSCSLIQPPLQLLKRPPLHQNIKGSSTQNTHLPEMRKKVLRDDQMPALGRKLFSIMFRQLSIGIEQSLLPHRALRRKPSLAE